MNTLSLGGINNNKNNKNVELSPLTIKISDNISVLGQSGPIEITCNIFGRGLVLNSVVLS